ncbi:MAG: hypothetical protein QOG34_2534 [Frankiaceae bacterium]|jgi:hypothetical protein|nr:hypothetical protein [Frankiaceae bacterium]
MMALIVEADGSMTLRCDQCPTYAEDLGPMSAVPHVVELSTTHVREAHPAAAPRVAPDVAYLQDGDAPGWAQRQAEQANPYETHEHAQQRGGRGGGKG